MKRKPKTFTISDDLLNNALAMTRQPIERCEVAPGYVEYYTPCASGQHGQHIVTVSNGYVLCDCAAFGICKHQLSSVGRPALHCVFQLRAARDLEDVQAIVDVYSPAVRELPAALRSLVRREYGHRDEQVRRSGSLAQQAVQQAA